MSLSYLPRHGKRGRDGYPSLAARVAIVAAVLAACMAVTLGPLYLGGMLAADPVPNSGQGWEDERYQDPSGYPYCTYPDDGLRPCIDAQSAQVHRY